jgi:hypothetical protein
LKELHEEEAAEKEGAEEDISQSILLTDQRVKSTSYDDIIKINETKYSQIGDKEQFLAKNEPKASAAGQKYAMSYRFLKHLHSMFVQDGNQARLEREVRDARRENAYLRKELEDLKRTVD